MIRERLVCFTRKFIRNIVWVFGQYSSTLSIWPLLLFTTFIRLICQPAATAVTSRHKVWWLGRNRRKTLPSKERNCLCSSLPALSRVCTMAARRERPPRLSLPRPLTGAVGPFLNLSPLVTSFVAFNWIRNRFYAERSDGSQSGVNCFYILWKRSFYSPRIRFNTHLTQTLILSPRSPISSDRESNSCNLVLISNTSHHLVLTLRSSQSRLFPLRDAACFDSSEAAAGTCSPLENMFSQKALLTQVIQSIQCRVGPTCYSRQLPNMNWKYGYMHGLRLRWIRNFLRWDSE